MMASRIGAAVLAASLLSHPVRGNEYASYQLLESPPGALQPCRSGMLLTLPEAWQSGDGAVVLVSMEEGHDATRDVLVSTLLYEHAAVLEFMPMRCGAASSREDAAVAGALEALSAVKRAAGAGMVIAIGYGPGSQAMLNVVRSAAAAQPGADQPRYAAAVALGDGTPAFALGAPTAAQEDPSARLGALCRALVGVIDGMGAAPHRAAPAFAAAGCLAALAGEEPPIGQPIRWTAPR